jgi:hypothetical protein
LSDLFIYGLCAHVVADWFFQNDWMAKNKVSLKHSAAWVHSGIHLVCFLPVFGVWALAVFATHLIIDTRKPLIWWRKTFKMTTDPANPASMHVAIWQDQMAHILVIIAVARWLA